jgi:serine/threonine protein kinase
MPPEQSPIETDDSFIGSTFGNHYLIKSLIGSGAWSSVYAATHLGLKKKIAIKILRRELTADINKVRRFEKEAQSTSQIHHQNLAIIYDYGLMPLPFIAMEFLDGPTLAAVINNRGCIEQNQALVILRQLCAALNAIHSAGIVHRDLKPSNIILLPAENNMVKLFDFGVAKTLFRDDEHSFDLTSTGDILGSPAYMSPEQFGSNDVDERSDLYALGCIAFEMLTGRKVFQAQGALEWMHAHLNETPEAFLTVCPEKNISRELEAVVKHCLEKVPAQRYQNALAVENDISCILGGKKPSVLSTSYEKEIQFLFRRIVDRVARHRIVVLLTAAMVVLTGWLILNGKELYNAYWQNEYTKTHNLLLSQRYKEAEGEARYLNKLCSPLSPLDERSLRSQRILATTLRLQGRKQDADSVDNEIRLLIDDQCTPGFAEVVFRKGERLMESGRLAEYDQLFQQAMNDKTVCKRDGIQYAVLLSQLGYSAYQQGKLSTSEVYLRRSLNIEQKLLSAQDIRMAGCMNLLGNTLFRQGKFSDALFLYQSAVRIVEQLPNQGREHEAVKFLSNLGTTYRRLRRPADAEAVYERARETALSRRGRSSAELIVADEQLADLYTEMGKLEDAKDLLQEASILIKEVRPEDKVEHVMLINFFPPDARILHKLADIFASLHMTKEAENTFKECLNLNPNVYSSFRGAPLEAVSVMRGYAELLRKNNRLKDSDRLLEQAKGLELRLKQQ